MYQYQGLRMKYPMMCLLFNIGLCQTVVAEPLIYNNLYLSYVSEKAAQSIAQYVQQQGLGGISLRDFRGDAGFNNQHSLLKAIAAPFEATPISQEKPQILGYWSNEGIYTNDPKTRAIPEAPYGVPGSKDLLGYPVLNPDFTDKLVGMNGIVYGFLQAQTQTYSYVDNKPNQVVTVNNKTPDAIGTLYFTDPHADLSTAGASLIQDAFCRKNNTICDFTLTNRNQAIELKNQAKMGNFTAFTLIDHKNNDNTLGHLLKFISVGGPSHEASFEDAFNQPNGIENFVNSAKTLLSAYPIDGIDLDYENPRMTANNAEHFALLVAQLKEAMPDKLINITILSDTAYLNGLYEGHYGFANHTLRDIAPLVNHINLITYQVDGALTKSQDGSLLSSFLSNLTIPLNAPNGYQLSIENSVNAALIAGASPAQLMLSIPTYGSAFAGIKPDNNGLFNPISITTPLPQGDLDALDCSTAIKAPSPKRCRGAFQYHYILEHMLDNGLTETNHETKGIVIGTTAYGVSWSPPTVTNYQLKITNVGKLSDLSFNVSIGDFVAPDFFNVLTDKIYDAKTTARINGQDNLTVKWSTSWGPSGQCNLKLNFTRNTHVIMKITPDNTTGKYITYCTFAGLGVYT